MATPRNTYSQEDLVIEVAQAIRQEYNKYRIAKGDPPMVPWDNMEPRRQVKWKRMAAASIETSSRYLEAITLQTLKDRSP